jgi:ABC-type branched-subunit amino acid transport system substrate-binding protein
VATGPSSALAPVQVGIGVDGNDAAFAAAFGATQSQPDEKRVAEAIVTDINHPGGLAGHRLAPVYAVFDNTSNDWVGQDQAICAAFTQDNHVAAAVRTDDIFGPLDACLAKAGVPLVLWESVFRPTTWWSAAPGLRYTPDEASGPRVYAALAARMVATGRWTKAARIGLVRYDRNDQADLERDAVRPALKAHGLDLTASEQVHTPASFSDLGSTSSQLASAILRFRQKGIDNVVFMGGDIAYLFSNAAESQQYRPRYALTSFDFPNEIPQPAQLAGAFGVGWEPSYDISTRRAATPGLRRCEKALTGTGAVFDAAGSGRLYIACDHLYFLQAAYAAAGRVGPGALASGISQLRSGFAPAFTFAADAVRHPDGLSSYHDLLYDAGCSCLRYGNRSDLP